MESACTLFEVMSSFANLTPALAYWPETEQESAATNNINVLSDRYSRLQPCSMHSQCAHDCSSTGLMPHLLAQVTCAQACQHAQLYRCAAQIGSVGRTRSRLGVPLLR
jgi:hypothetical protein